MTSTRPGIQTTALPPDYHMHTALCKHANGTPEAYRATAAIRKVETMAFTDHGPDPSGYDLKHRMTITQYPSYLLMIRSLQDGKLPKVLLGIEADYYPGAEPFLKDWLPHQPFDLILGSVNSIRAWGFDSPDTLHTWDSVTSKGYGVNTSPCSVPSSIWVCLTFSVTSIYPRSSAIGYRTTICAKWHAPCWTRLPNPAWP